MKILRVYLRWFSSFFPISQAKLNLKSPHQHVAADNWYDCKVDLLVTMIVSILLQLQEF